MAERREILLDAHGQCKQFGQFYGTRRAQNPAEKALFYQPVTGTVARARR
jgi:hypothetical protein